MVGARAYAKFFYVTVGHEALRCVTAHPLKFKQYAEKIFLNI
ncbi:unnamed protein product [Mycetohabitans rhizoxinica HKI 454]|uniref:Uncharacterized protein n=1 Tax=Mycetohabitans rhizoxinica (strain DSM 19002 / CIP 109453 / HKI 454) TaxID=882378 RepID=E5ARY9_MYCRK|nr:unnamed protein product [Mycetohabitans rhizoxinica HKI 454]